MKAERPLGQRKMARLHYRASRYGESAAAGIAVKQAGAVRLTMEAVNSFRFAAVRAERAVRPMGRLEVLSGLGFVEEDRVGQVHDGLVDAAESTPSGRLCQRDNCRDVRANSTAR